MTQEEKQLLLTDISSRIPYGLKFFVDNTIPPLPSSEDYRRGEVFSVLTATGLDIWEGCIFTEETGMDCVLFAKRNGKEIQVLKPYLRPMSSMTEEEKNEASKLGICYDGAFHNDIYDVGTSMEEAFAAISWLLERHFDINYLIQKGLALEAPEGMYK